MTITTQIVEYALDGDGQSVDFSFPGRIDVPDDLQAAIVVEGGALEVRPFSVTGDTLGATVTFGAAPAVGERVIMWRATPHDQKVDYATGDFPSATHEQNSDRIVMMVQERKDMERRVLRISRAGGDVNEMNQEAFVGRAMFFDPYGQPTPSLNTTAALENAAYVVTRALAEEGLSRGANLDFGLIDTAPETLEDWGLIE